MIAWLTGTVVDASTQNCIVLNVNGVGYSLETTVPTYMSLATQINPVTLLVYTHVREDALTLFGFIEQEERALFKALIRVNGIGPKSAMAILSSMSPGMFVQCIQSQDRSMLTKLPGVGSKTAERILIEMKDLLKDSILTQLHLTEETSSSIIVQEAISALEALGYKRQDAVNTIKKIDTAEKDSQTLIKLALQQLGKNLV